MQPQNPRVGAAQSAPQPNHQRSAKIRQQIHGLMKQRNQAAHTPTPGIDPTYQAQYEGSVNNLGATKNTALLGIGLQRTQLDNSYGFGQDPTTNPYSQAAQLQSSLDTARRHSTNSYASSGQLYSGALVNAQDANRANYDQGYNDLQKSYLADEQKLNDAEAAAKSDYRTGVLGAHQTAVDNTLKTDPSPAGPGPKYYTKRIHALKKQIGAAQGVGRGRPA